MKKLLTLAVSLAAFGVSLADAALTSDGESIRAITAPVTNSDPGTPGCAGPLFFSSDYYEDGPCILDTTTGAATHIGVSGVDSENVGLSPSPSDNILYGSRWWIFAEINTDGSGYVEIGGDGHGGLSV